MKLRNLFRRGSSESSAGGDSRRRGPMASSEEGVVITTAEELDRYLRGQNESGSGATVTETTAMRVAAVYRCVTLISAAVATMPLHIKRREDERTRVDVSDHALWRLLRRRPNPWQTPSQFRRMLQGSLLLRGMGYARKVRNARGEVQALIPLHADRMRVEQTDDFTLRFRYTTKDGRQVTIPQRDMFWLTGMTLDGINGLSVLSYAREAMGMSLTMESHGGSLFKNGTNLGAVLEHPKNLSEKGQENLKESLAEFRGASNAGKTLLLEEGMEYKPLGMSLEDAQFIEGRGFQRSEIFMFFGVPPHMAGDTTKATSWGSGIEQQSLGFVAYTLEDWLATWEESIARDLIGDDEPDVYARFNRAALVRGDIKTRYQGYSIARQWSLATINEIRSLEDWNPIEGGDDLFVPGNANSTRPSENESEDEDDSEGDSGSGSD